MTIPSGPIPTFPATIGLQDGRALNKLSQLLGSTQNNVTAKAGGTKAAATVLTACKVQIQTCANDADSVKLPAGYPGLEVKIFNNTAHSVQVFGSGNDTINAVVTATGVAQAAGLSAVYTCYNVVAGVGQWGRVLSA